MAIFFIILSIIVTFAIIIKLSHLKIKVQLLRLINNKLIDFESTVSVVFLNKIDIIKIRINKDKIANLRKSNIIKKLTKKIQERIMADYDKIKDLKIEDIKEYLQLLKKVELKNIDIDIKIGTESAPITAFVTAFISLVITFLVAKNAEESKFKVLPMYNHNCYLNLTTKCIISIKLVHIMSVIKMVKEKRGDKQNGRTFNRRTYANRYG